MAFAGPARSPSYKSWPSALTVLPLWVRATWKCEGGNGARGRRRNLNRERLLRTTANRTEQPYLLMIDALVWGSFTSGADDIPAIREPRHECPSPKLLRLRCQGIRGESFFHLRTKSSTQRFVSVTLPSVRDHVHLQFGKVVERSGNGTRWLQPSPLIDPIGWPQQAP